MIFYYISVVVFGIFAVIFLVGCAFILIQNQRKPWSWHLDKARNDLLQKETKTGTSELNSGMYSKVSNEMLRDMAELEGFRFVEKSDKYLSFQRELTQSSSSGASAKYSGSAETTGGDLGYKRRQDQLKRTLSEAANVADLTLRRDQLGALPKAEILRTAQEHGWAFRDEEIVGNEWRLLFRRENPVGEMRGTVAT